MHVTQLLAIARTQHDAFTWQQAVDTVGKQRFLRMLKRGFAKRVHPGTYVIANSADTWEQKCWAAVLSVPGALLAGESAARWYGLKVKTKKVVLNIPSGSTPVRAGVTLHQASNLAATRKRSSGMPITSVVQALIDLSAEVSFDKFEVGLRTALMLKKTNLHSLGKAVEALPSNQLGRVRPLLTMLAELNTSDEKVESWFEDDVLGWIREAGFPEPQVQFRIAIDATTTYRADFCYPEQRIILEPDGPGHLIPSVARHDRDRRNALMAMGWTFLSAGLDTNPRVFMASFTKAWLAAAG